MSLEVIASDANLCGEGPIWDREQERLVWNDMSSSLVYQLVPSTGEKTIISRDLMAAGIALNHDGALVFAGATGLHLWNGQDNYRTLLTHHNGERLYFNDIIADARGRLYAGTMYWGEAMEKTGGLYLIDTDGSIHIVDDAIELANGLAFSPDDGTLYFADSSARKIYAYDVDRDTGNLSNKRIFVQVPRDEGLPDGMTVDADGFLWCAQWYGSQVVRYDPEGVVERRVAVPARQTSSVAFGGPELNDLYITSAGEAWPSELVPAGYDGDASNSGGDLYRIKLDVQGRIEHRTRF